MTTSHELASPSRRAILAAPLVLPAVVGGTSSGSALARPGPASDTLVAFYSRTGNTRVIAGQIRRARGADLFEIRTVEPYPEDYERTVEQARRETEASFEPALATDALDIARYRTIYLGFPIWGQTAPPAIRSFLKAHAWAGKTIRPFVTHGGYGLGTSMAVLASHSRGALRAPPFAIEADQERRTLSRVTDWLGAA
ncbi:MULTISPECIES: flavodoxin [Bosea]|uniref:Flavodoxin n=1 Tax=Bosea vaviloviae TaxID=1526658 RepID=A0A0N1N0V9_9HYPH|nr:flavodoxin [Bosea vaviloviae]KPH77797.1 flavodoxin [Bosea vaviloviae]